MTIHWAFLLFKARLPSITCPPLLLARSLEAHRSMHELRPVYTRFQHALRQVRGASPGAGSRVCVEGKLRGSGFLGACCRSSACRGSWSRAVGLCNPTNAPLLRAGGSA